MKTRSRKIGNPKHTKTVSKPILKDPKLEHPEELFLPTQLNPLDNRVCEQSLCRACRLANNNTQSIFDAATLELFTECTGLQPHPEDGLPNCICNVCIDTCKTFHIFKQQCRINDEIYKTELSIKVEASLDDDPLEKLTVSEDKWLGDDNFDNCSEDTEVDSKNEIDSKVECNAPIEVNTYTYVGSSTPVHIKEEHKIENNEAIQTISIGENCQLNCMNSRNREDHLIFHELVIGHRCKKCDITFENGKAQNKHLKTEHAKETVHNYICKICERGLSTYHRLQNHYELTHIPLVECPSNGRCPKCNCEKPTEKLLLYHIAVCGRKQPMISLEEATAMRREKRKLKPKRPRKIPPKHLTPKEVTPKTIPCRRCPELLLTELARDRHEFCVHDAMKDMKCYTCDMTFISLRHLQKHHRINHPDESLPNFVCRICGKTFRNILSLKLHFFNHPELEERVRELDYLCCPNCNEVKAAENMEGHLSHCKKVTECPICKKKVKKLRLHISLHKETCDVLCNHCGQMFKSRNLMMAHLVKSRMKEEGEKECDICHKVFAHKYALKIHRRIHEKTAYVHACDRCPKTFLNKSVLKKHLAIHTRETLVCKLCNASYKTAERYREHVDSCRGPITYKTKPRLNRTKRKMFECQLCDFKFRGPVALKGHLIDVHSNVESINIFETFENHKKFQCNICSKRFFNKDHITGHKNRMHVEFQRKKCPKCHKMFKTNVLGDHVYCCTAKLIQPNESIKEKTPKDPVNSFESSKANTDYI